MALEQNSGTGICDLVKAWQDAYNSGNLDALEGLLDPDWFSNSWPEGLPKTVELAKQMHRATVAAFPDLHYSTELLIAANDWVVQRYVVQATHTGDFANLRPTGKRLTCGGVNLFRIANGRIVEHWAYADDIGLLAQAGAELPPEWLSLRHH